MIFGDQDCEVVTVTVVPSTDTVPSIPVASRYSRAAPAAREGSICHHTNPTTAATRAMVNDRILAQGKVPWTTLGAAKASLEGREDTAEIMEIRRWFAEFEEAVKARLEPVS